MIYSLRNFSKPSPFTDQLSFARGEEGVKSLQLEGTTDSRHRYQTVGYGHSESVWLVYRFLGAWTAGIPPAFLQMEIICIRLDQWAEDQGWRFNCRLMGLDQSQYSPHGGFGLSEALNANSGFLDLNLMPLNTQHMALVGERIRPHRAGILRAYSPSDMFINHWILRGRSMAQVHYSCWWVRVRVMLHCYRPCLFSYMAGINDFRGDQLRNVYSPFWTRNLSSLVDNVFSGLVLSLGCYRSNYICF